MSLTCASHAIFMRRSAEDELMATADDRDALAEQLEAAKKQIDSADQVRLCLSKNMLVQIESCQQWHTPAKAACMANRIGIRSSFKECQWPQ